MTPKQADFARQYALDHCGAAAAVRAGYAPRAARQTANELLRKPAVRALVSLHEANAEQALGLSRTKVIAELRDAVSLAHAQGDAVAMIAGWREIGKMCGFYAPERKQVHLSLDSTRHASELETLSNAELLALVDGASGL